MIDKKTLQITANTVEKKEYFKTVLTIEEKEAYANMFGATVKRTTTKITMLELKGREGQFITIETKMNEVFVCSIGAMMSGSIQTTDILCTPSMVLILSAMKEKKPMFF